MSAILFRMSGPFTPATASEDFGDRIGPAELPQMIGFTYWIVSPGSVLAGAVSMDWRWVDAQGETRTISGSPISLQDGSASFSAPVQVMTREAADSDVFLDVTLIGLADGSPTVAYAIVMTTGTQEGQCGF